MSLLPENTPIVEVTREDQQMICAFSRHHMCFLHLRQRSEELQRRVGKLETAGTDLMDCDGAALLEFGTALLAADAVDLEAAVSARAEVLEQERAQLEQECAAARRTLDKLKAVLTGRFGNAINLNYEK